MDAGNIIPEMNAMIRRISGKRQSCQFSGFYENAGIKVAAALRRGGSPVQTARRSGDSGPTIGSHAPPMPAISICGSQLEKVMRHFHENLLPKTNATECSLKFYTNRFNI